MRDDDRWLDPWLQTLRQHAGGNPVLELGCGDGRDTAVLAGAGFDVQALDRSSGSLLVARGRLLRPAGGGRAHFTRGDLRDPWPPGPYGAVLASLSLHYFDWPTTEALVQRVAGALAPGGLLLCRLNSTADHHWGASGHPAIDGDPHYRLVDGQPKRFFDRADVLRLFDARHWQHLALEEQVIDRYAQPKAAWLLAAVPVG